MATSKLTSLAEQKKAAGHKTMSKDATVWLKEKIEELKKVEIQRLPAAINREKTRQTAQFRLGMMYCFYYDPKTKADLEYWDRFPMVLVLERYNDGFLGLNLHYLPVKWRVAFLAKLMRFAQLTPDDDIKRMRISYDILEASKRYAEFRPCLKRYLLPHVRSKLLMIQPNEWDVATMLPLQQFRGAKPQEVWKDSILEWKNHMSHFNQED
jgi:hypothetical protein